MNDRIEMNMIKGIVFIILFVVLICKSIISDAQIKAAPFYKGLQASYSTISFQPRSSIATIDAKTAMLSGGQIGIHFGGAIFRTTIGLLGYYSSVNNFPGTVDLYKNFARVSFFPLEIFRPTAIVQPYLSTGAAYDRYKFSGYYLNNDAGQVNYSRKAPHLATIRQLDLYGGAGITVKILDNYDFVHLFAEALYGKAIGSAPAQAEFANTSINNNVQITAGLIFGARR